MRSDKKKEVLILGGGFGGVMAARTLADAHPRGLSITLVDKNEFHSFNSDFYEVATAFISEEFHKSESESKLQFHELRSSAAILFKDIFAREDITVVRGEVKSIDFAGRSVALKHGASLSYDYLVVALGSSTNFFGIPHLSERALEMKSLQDALNVRNTTDELFMMRAKHDVIRIVIAGGGFTGCELAGELVGYVKKLSATHAHPVENIECSIVEGSPMLLGPATKWVQEEAHKHLVNLGVKIHLNALITNVHEHELELKDGTRMPYDLIVWTAGIRANEITEGLVKDTQQQKACLVVDHTLALKGQKGVYAIGDIAYSTAGEKPDRLPATAQLAISQGAYVAQAILRREAGYAALPYKPISIRYVIPLGSKFALADIGWLQVSGWPAWMLKRLIALRYFMKLLPWDEAWKHWRGGLRMYIQNDE